jgi:hypothetical protein
MHADAHRYVFQTSKMEYKHHDQVARTAMNCADMYDSYYEAKIYVDLTTFLTYNRSVTIVSSVDRSNIALSGFTMRLRTASLQYEHFKLLNTQIFDNTIHYLTNQFIIRHTMDNIHAPVLPPGFRFRARLKRHARKEPPTGWRR